ncbi:MAG: hypothetical protein OSB09_06460 [Planctomycetota bacterium]|nr:hypothetical protein [Planctomycetota bacterium]
MKTTKIAFTLALALLLGAPAFAQYDLSLSSAEGAPGSSADLQVLLDNNGDDIQGWSFGVCHDGQALSLTAVVDGATTMTVKNGDEPDFNQVNVVSDEGFTVGVVICFVGCASLPTGTTGNELNVASYELLGAAGSSTSVDFCNSLGSPAVEILVVVGGQSILPSTASGTIDLVAGPPPFDFAVADHAIDYDGLSGEATFTVSPTIQEHPDNSGFPSETQGVSMGMAHDSSLLTVNSVSWNADLGIDPDFAETAAYDGGWTIGVVYSFTGQQTLAFESATPVLNAEYSTVGAALAGLETDTTTALAWSNDLGSPSVVNIVVVGGNSIDPSLTDGSVTLSPSYAPPDVAFVRGNCNGDQSVNIADGIWILNEMFQGGPAGTCAEACDANSDDFIDTADAIFVISYRLLSGPVPSAPFPECGIEEGADCESASNCP